MFDNPENFLITDGFNTAVFEKPNDGLYLGHYELQARGKDALAVALNMLDLFFEFTGQTVLRGLTPVENRKACWFSRRLGFESCGHLDTPFGLSELFVLVRDK